MTWKTDEYGIKKFTHDGWEITIWSAGNWDVDYEGEEDWRLDVNEDGSIEVFGEDTGSGGSWHADSPCTVTIPRVILTELWKLVDANNANEGQVVV